MNSVPNYLLIEWDNDWHIRHYGVKIEDIEMQKKRFPNAVIFIELSYSKNNKEQMSSLMEMFIRKAMSK